MSRLKMKYFVLNPESSDKEFAKASIVALQSFAIMISVTDNDLSKDILNWIDEIRANQATE